MTIKKLKNDMPILWSPERVEFREYFNEKFRDALLHAKKHGDITSASRLINTISQNDDKRLIILRCENHFQILWDEERQTFRGKFFALSDAEISEFQVIKKALPIPIREGDIVVDKGIYSKNEFLDFMLDTIVLNRNMLSVDDLEKIEETLEIIKKKLHKKISTKN